MKMSKTFCVALLLGLVASAAASDRSLTQAPEAAATPADAAAEADAPAPEAPPPTPAQAAAAAIKAISEAKGTVTNYPYGGKEGKDLPRIVGPTFKFGFKDGIGAFQGWNGGLELPKVIDVGGQRVTRSGLRGRKLSQAAPAAEAAAAPADAPAPEAPPPTPAQAAAAAIKAISEAKGTVTNYPYGGKEGKDLPRIVGPTFKFGFKDGIGAFQGWNGGLELPKVIDVGGQRVTRSGLRGRKLSQAAPAAEAAAAPADAPAAEAPPPTPAQAAAAAIKAISEAKGTVTNYPYGGKEGKDLPRIVGPTFKFGFKDGIGAFQGWNGGLELPKVIDVGGQRVTRSGLRGRKLSQAAPAAEAAAAPADAPAPEAPPPTPAQAAAAAIKAISEAKGTVTNYPYGGKEGKDLPRIVGPTFKFGFKDGIGAFQGWNGGLELPKVIDVGGQRVTRSGLRGRKLSQAAPAAEAAAAPADAPAPEAPPPTPAQAAAAAIKAISEAKGTVTNYPYGGKEGKDLPRIVGPTFKFGFKDGIGAFQGWNGGLELPKVIDVGGQRVTRSGLRGRRRQ